MLALGVLAAGVAACGASHASGPEISPADIERNDGPAPGDQIVIEIDREPELSGTYTVGSTGTVFLPRLGAVKLAGLPTIDLQSYLAGRYSEFLRNPSLRVTVLRRIAVHGEVRNPSVFMVDPSMSLSEVIAMAGGMTPMANGKEVRIVRGGEEMRVRTSEMLAQPVTGLRSGDQIVVGRKHWLAQNPIGAIGTAAGVIAVLITQIIPGLR
jgi:polysaccharide biosynthesis/export protein